MRPWRPRRRHHAGWWALMVALSLLSTVIVLALAAFLSLRTEWGGGLARDLALPRVNQTIAGRLEVADFRYRGRSVELRGVVLRDPEGEKVAELRRALVVFSPLALLRKRVDVQEVLLEQPALALERSEKGWNLVRAIAPRKKPTAPAQPPPPRQDPSALKVDVHRVNIQGGLLQMRDLAPAGLPTIQLAELHSDGSVHLNLGSGSTGGTVDSELHMQGSTLSPIRAPFRLDLAAEAVGEKGKGSVRVSWGGSRVDLAMHSRDRQTLDLAVNTVRVEPGLIRRFVVGYPVRAPVEVHGSAALRGQAARAELSLAAAGTRGHLRAQADIQRRQARILRFDLKDVNLAELLVGGPRSRFDLVAEASGGGRDVQTASLKAEVRVLPGAQIEGKQLGPVRARLQGEGGRYRLEELLAVLPGLRVSGQGEKEADKIALDLEVHADDLGLAARSLGAPARLGVAGRGDVTASLRGSMRRPELKARAHVPLLKVAGNAIDDLKLSVRSEGRELPIEAQGQLQVASIRAGARRFTKVAASVSSARSGRFSLQASTATPTPVAVRAGGRARAPSPGSVQVDLARLELDYPRGSWRLTGPARLESGPRRLQVTGLELQAEPEQRLAVDLRQRGKVVDAHLVVTALDLARLPPGVVPPSRRLAGRFSAEVRTRGRLPAPELDLQASLREGRVDRFNNVSLDLSARNRQREGIAAKLRVMHGQSPLAELDGKVGAALDELMHKRVLAAVPITIDARVGPLRVQRVGLPTAATDPNGGRPVLRALVEARLGARGTLADPQVRMHAQVGDARLGNTPLGNADLRVAYQDAQPRLDARVDTAKGGRLNLALQARADLSLPSVRRGLQVRTIPLQGELSAQALDLGVLSGINDTVRAVGGLLEAQGKLQGTVGAPQLAGRLAWKNGRLLLAGFGEYRDIDLSLRGDQKEMVLERLFARSGSGSAEVSGKAVRDSGGQQLAVDARARLRKFRFYTEGQAVGDLSVDATANGRVAPDRIGFTVSLPEAHFELAEGKRKKVQSLRRPADIVILENGQPRDAREAKKLRAATEPTEAAGTAPRLTRVTVDADRNLWVRGPDMNIEVGLEPGFVFLQAAEPGAFGTVKVLRGYVQVFGRKFDLTPGSTISFSGPLDQPRLSVDAVYRAEASGSTVNVHIAGPADRLSFTLSSPEHPEYGDTELLSLVLTGRLPDEAGGGSGAAPSDRAASLLGGVLAGRLQKALSKRLPLDVLLLEPGQDLEGARLEAGTYVGDDLYVAYVGRMGVDPFARENRNEIHLELQLGRRWSIEGSYGDARRGSVDLLWDKSY
jgi:autotransporter translocation and assembly factor TamB